MNTMGRATSQRSSSCLGVDRRRPAGRQLFRPTFKLAEPTVYSVITRAIRLHTYIHTYRTLLMLLPLADGNIIIFLYFTYLVFIGT